MILFSGIFIIAKFFPTIIIRSNAFINYVGKFGLYLCSVKSIVGLLAKLITSGKNLKKR